MIWIALTPFSCREGGVTIFARADTRARMNWRSRRQSRVAAIMMHDPDIEKLILPQHQ
jgi:hypothetical protein